MPARDSDIPAVDFVTNRVSSTDFTVAGRYAPSEDILFRASFGTGFLPPSITQLAVDRQSFPVTLTDPKRGGVPMMTSGNVDVLLGGNPSLTPEESKSFSAGVVLTPGFFPGFRFSADYVRIRKSDEIANPLNETNILDFEDDFPGRVTRGPLTPEDEVLGYTAGEVVALDFSALNTSSSTVEAFDFQLNYNRETGKFGDFALYAVATLQTATESQVLPTSDVIDRTGFSDGPLEWRGNIGLDWSGESLSFGWNAQFFDSYTVYSSTASDPIAENATLTQGTDTVPSQIYHDMYARYRFEKTEGVLANSEVLFGIQNIFNEDPPILAATGSLFIPVVNPRGYSPYGDPRLRRYTLSFRKSF